MNRRVAAFLLILGAVTSLVLWTSPPEADARAGGGSSYSRSSSSSSRSSGSSSSSSSSSRSSTYSRPASHGGSSSHGSSVHTYSRSSSVHSSGPSTSNMPPGSPVESHGSGGAIAGLILLGMLGVCLVAFVLLVRRKGPDFDNQATSDRRWAGAKGALRRLRELDPSFSETVFLDFVQLLYQRLHDARGRQDMASIAPYLAPAACADQHASAASRHLTRVDEVIIGTCRIDSVGGFDPDSKVIRLEVGLDANYTEHSSHGSQRFYTTERLTFVRKKGVASKSPEDIGAFACPSCGAPSELRPDGSCPYCDQVVNRGDFQWILAERVLTEESPQPKSGLTESPEERGTDDPDVLPPDFVEARTAFRESNPDFDPGAFENHVRECFVKIQQAWSSGQWEQTRALVADGLFNANRYWLDLYQANRIRNELRDISIERIVPVRFDQDAFYDLITVRIHASMLDYFVDLQGQVVGGNRLTPRRFSEYWTFLRRRDLERLPPSPSGGCPNCGAPLAINNAGECEHCATKLNSGRFDWVLAAIEQDDSYVAG